MNGDAHPTASSTTHESWLCDHGAVMDCPKCSAACADNAAECPALRCRLTTERVQADFDEIARLAVPGASRTDRYDRLLLSLVPAGADRVLDVGCGLGHLTWAIATRSREVVGVDISPVMIERARAPATSTTVGFRHGDFLDLDFAGGTFDCIVSVSALHHMADDIAIGRMVNLLRPGGRLIVHDVRRNTRLGETLRACAALTQTVMGRFMRTGRLRPPRCLREAWARHGATETYLSFWEAQTLADRLLPGARVMSHWQWRYTIVWDKPAPADAIAKGPG